MKYSLEASMKLRNFEIIVVIISTIICSISGYILAYVLLKNMKLFSGSKNPGEDTFIIILLFALFLLLICCAFKAGKKLVKSWEIREKIITLICCLSGIPLSILLVYLYTLI